MSKTRRLAMCCFAGAAVLIFLQAVRQVSPIAADITGTAFLVYCVMRLRWLDKRDEEAKR